MASVRELSGILTDCAKWQTTWELLSAEDCAVEHLRVFHNTADQLRAICTCLVGNKSVKALEVGAAEGEGCNALAKLLALNERIQSLTILNLGDSDQHAAALSAALQSNTSIQQLTLQKLQPSQVALVCRALAAEGCSGQLQQLQLPGARLDAAAAAALQAAVTAHQQLDYLNLQSAVFVRHFPESSTATPGATAQLFSPALAIHPSLSKLELQQASGVDAAALGRYFAAAAAAGNKALQAVFLDGIGLGDAGMQQLAASAALGPPTTPPSAAAAAVECVLQSPEQNTNSSGGVGLTHLSLTDNSIGPLGAKALGQLLGGQGFEQLLVLNLNQNALSSEGLAALAEGLVAAGCCCLQELHLESNSIKGVEGLLTLLSSPAGRSLTTLNLSHNCIADEAACQLAATAAAAAGNSGLGLKHINLSHNWIKDDGAEGLAGLLKAHTTLVALELQKNRIGCKGIDTLILAAFANPGLQQMSLDGNRVRDNRTKLDIEGLGRALASRRQGGVSSRRLSAAGAAVSEGLDCSAAAGAVAAAAAAAAAGSTGGNQNSSSSTLSSTSIGKQGLYDRQVYACAGDAAAAAADASAAVAAAGRAAKIARLDIDSSTGLTTAAVNSAAASPFAAQAQSSSGWSSSHSGLARPAGPDSQAAGPGATSAASNTSAAAAEALHGGLSVEQGFAAGFPRHVADPRGIPPGQFGAFPGMWTPSDVGESMSGPFSGLGCGLGLQQLPSLPNGVMRKLRKQGSRSYSFEFWAKSGKSADCNGSTTLAPCSGGQAQPGFQAVAVAAGQQQPGLALSALEAASLSLAALAEPDPLPSLDWHLGIAPGGPDVIDSLSGWVLDDAVTGQSVLSGLRNNSMNGLRNNSMNGSNGNRLGTLDWSKAAVDSSDGGGATLDGASMPICSSNGSSSQPGSPKASGVVRRFGSGRVLVRKASLSRAAAASAAAQNGLSRFGKSVVPPAPEMP